jgi:Fur family transcriptional regulator, ferric uptake regulator
MSAKKTKFDVETLRQTLRKAGLKGTTSRLMVLEYLSTQSAPTSHTEVAEALGPRGFDRATLYRNLIDLTEVGLLSRSDLGDHTWRFELTKDTHTNDHPHFVCTDCGDVSCLPSGAVQITASLNLPHSVQTKSIEVQVKGVCDRCE